MSRGRGGPSKEHYYRHPPPHVQARDNFHRPGTGVFYPRAGPQQIPHPSYYDGPAHPEAHIQPSSPLIPSTPPTPSHIKVVPNSVTHNSLYSQNHGAGSSPNSFHDKQREFLTGQISEAPQFRATVSRGGGGGGFVPNRSHSTIYQPQSGYCRYPNPSNSSPRGRGGYSQDRRPYRPGAGSSRGNLAPRHLNQNQFQGKNYNQHSSRQWRTQTDSLCDKFQSLLLKDRPNREGERFDRHPSSSSSGNLSFCKPNITLTTEIQGEVHEALGALKPSESISAKVLARKLHLPKKVVNKALYSLEHLQKASKQGLTPPEWTLYREPLRVEEDQTSSEPPQKPEEKSSAQEQKEQIFKYLLQSREATALNIAKNIGLKTAKQVNSTLYALEKQGEVVRNVEVNPPTWELSTHRRERMERSLKAAQSNPAVLVKMEVEEEEVSAIFSPSPLPPLPGLEVLTGGWIPDQILSEAPLSSASGKSENANEGQWSTDDIPEFLNAIRRETDAEKKAAEKANAMGTVAVSVAAPPPQNLWAKLQEVRLKNPVSGLMEYAQYLGQNCEFLLLDQSGPSHDPRFRMQVMLNGRLFPVAEASSKKVAKKDAAAATLRILVKEMQGGTCTADEENTGNVEQVMELLPDTSVKIIFVTSVTKLFSLMFTSFFCTTASPVCLLQPQLPLGPSSGSDESFSGATCPSLPPLTADELRAAHEAGVGDLINHLNNNAVSGLLEYARARGFAAEIRLVGQSGPPHDPKFTYQAKLGGRWFPPVCASNKKQGKQEAADAALRVLIGEAERAARTGELTPAELPVSGSTLHDQIAMLSHQRFNALTTRIQHCLLGRKILATIIMRRGEGLGTVVSLGTGNRCVKGEELSLKGETVNDCHAEIISRRGFIRFLYSELFKHYEGADDSIFEPAENNKLRIKSDITFHLYISTAPCGDGALFDKSCSEAGDEAQGHQPLFENVKQGKLRTKVENGEGTIPVESSAIVPTWDGIQHGERLRTMSCSDKILRWNVIGLQGALLTHFLDPIYLKSITLGYLYSHGHLTRAVCCRLARDGEAFTQSLPAPFKLNHPEVGRVSVYDSTRHTGKTKESSVNWSFPDQHSVEVLDGTKGKVDGTKLAVSRVSKSNLFHLFRSLCQRSGHTDLLSLPSYAQAKMSAVSFQQAKQQFFQALSAHGYGAWIGKPLEEKSFEAGEGNWNNGAPVGNSNNVGAVEA
uniref:Adenosine deaminase RNA specific n=1 Tax=Oreochromis niloticus TaxID=8128 RepID=I3JGJ6_ORENI